MKNYISNTFTLNSDEVVESIISSTKAIDTTITVSEVDNAIFNMMKTSPSLRKTKNVRRSSKPNTIHGEYQKHSNTSYKKERNLHKSSSYSDQLPYLLGALNIALGVVLSCIITVVSPLFKVTVKLIRLLVKILRSDMVKYSVILIFYCIQYIVFFTFSILFSKRSSTSC